MRGGVVSRRGGPQPFDDCRPSHQATPASTSAAVLGLLPPSSFSAQVLEAWTSSEPGGPAPRVVPHLPLLMVERRLGTLVVVARRDHLPGEVADCLLVRLLFRLLVPEGQLRVDKFLLQLVKALLGLSPPLQGDPGVLGLLLRARELVLRVRRGLLRGLRVQLGPLHGVCGLVFRIDRGPLRGSVRLRSGLRGGLRGSARVRLGLRVSVRVRLGPPRRALVHHGDQRLVSGRLPGEEAAPPGRQRACRREHREVQAEHGRVELR
mmetsp:Transcript_93430/g.264523  ORF Transcript_93430/g.264523 Transcript_93430/m.264523 type:complete len:264 (-) Transcript_93430:48-839(-)